MRQALAAHYHDQLSNAPGDCRGCRGQGATAAMADRFCCRRRRSIGLRMVPMVRDLRYAWEETPRQVLDVQAEKVQESLHSALVNWGAHARRGQ